MVDGLAQLDNRAAWAGAGDVLARYGDIPVAYAVFHVTLNDDATEVLDTEYVFVNQEYLEWLGFGDVDLVGRSFLETIPDASTVWFPYCYRAVVLHERSHDVVYSPETESWLSFNVEPSPIEGCCVFAFVMANEEHEARELIEAERETSDDIIDIAGALNDEMGYDASMNGLLETMSRVIHPERLYIFERWEHTSSNTFEWCAPGVEPEIDMLQDLDNSEFATWDRMLATDSVVVIPDVSAYKGVDDRLYELLTMQGIDRLLAVPFYDNGELIGYLGADNYAVEERLDTRRLLETVASFVSARMANRRLMDKVEAARDTSDLIIGITDSLNGELGYDDAMNGLLETMSRIIHPERLYIFERWEHTSDNTFEWCAPGVEPQIDMLQNLDNSEFDTWDRMLSTDSVVVIPDVSAYKGVDDRLYELLAMQGIDRLLAVPFYDRGELIGYLGADNYAVEERLDTHRLLETVASFVSARMANRRLMDALEELGTHDSLTGLLNRRGIDAAIEEHMETHKGEPFIVALMDVDDFKTINDMYGHAVGDEALRVLADELRSKMPDECVIGRNGGDEALVMFPNESAQRIEAILDDLVNEGHSFELDGKHYTTTISVGYSWCDGSRDNLATAYSQADAALYSVKYNGKSGYRGFAPGMEARYQLQLGFASRRVVENLPEATVVLQPETAEVLFANDAMVELIGCNSLFEFVEFSQGAIGNLIHPDDRSRALETFKVRSERKTRSKFRLLTKAGVEKEVAYSGRCVEMSDGKPVVFVVLFELD